MTDRYSVVWRCHCSQCKEKSEKARAKIVLDNNGHMNIILHGGRTAHSGNDARSARLWIRMWTSLE